MLVQLLLLVSLPLTLPPNALTEPHPLTVASLSQDPNDWKAEVERLQSILDEHERIADATASCIVTAVVGAGADLLSTAAALNYCDGCAEANPIGFNTEARIGLKVSSLGIQIGGCYAAAKHSRKALSWTQWILRIFNYAAVLNNTVAAIRGKPFLNWGITKDIAP